MGGSKSNRIRLEAVEMVFLRQKWGCSVRAHKCNSALQLEWNIFQFLDVINNLKSKWSEWLITLYR